MPPDPLGVEAIVVPVYQTGNPLEQKSAADRRRCLHCKQDFDRVLLVASREHTSKRMKGFLWLGGYATPEPPPVPLTLSQICNKTNAIRSALMFLSLPAFVIGPFTLGALL